MLLEKLALYWQYPFVRHAFFVGIMIALCASLLGVTLVLRRFSFIGDGLSHVAFGALSVAGVLGLTNEMLLVLPVTILCAVLLLYRGRNAKIKGDASIAMLSVGALALGYLLLNLFPPSGNMTGDVCSTLFGSSLILTLSRTEVILCAILSSLVIAGFVLCYRRLLAITFDEDFARATGIKVDRHNLLLSVMIAVMIVLAMNLVGSLLISALIIFPALSAMRIFKSFFSVTICAATLSVVTAACGLVAAILADTPVGPTIVAADVAGFLMCSLIGKIRG